ncbi:MAG: hypothetical protein Q9186_000455 [Xanthomendoza sp. 1 TL-2023]
MASTTATKLWDRAVSTLTDEDKQAIDFLRADKPAILTDVLHAAEQKKQLCMQKRWKYTKKNGDIIIIRDLCDKMIRWVHKFKEVGDIAVQYDPSHASLPWAAIRFFLQLSVSDVQIFGAMAEGLETVTSHIASCHLYEQLYLSRASSAQSSLESLLLRLYTAILIYLAKARRYYDKSTLRRLGASVLETSDSVDACLAKVAAERDAVERCTRLMDSELLQHVDGTASQTQMSVTALADNLKTLTTDMAAGQQSLKDIMTTFEQPILRTASQLSDVRSKLKRNERREILSWLSTVRYREHHKTAIASVMPGSGKWLQRKAEFVNWKTSSSSSILWIHGIPGSGKSKLLSTLIQDLLELKSQQIASSALAYFYCARDAAETQRADPGEIMRAVLKQFSCFDASQPIHAAVLGEFEKRQKDADEDGSDPSKLSLRECKDLILEIADQLPIVFLIDALDECDPLKRHELLQALKDIVQKSSNVVKVIVSSRDDADIVCRLNNVPNVFIKSEDNGDDVNRFIELELDSAINEQRLLNGRVPAHLRDRILHELRSRAHGMFLWASLQIQNLCDPERMLVTNDVEAALQSLPPTLSQLYTVILQRIDRIASHGRHLATNALRWLLCARTPLTSKTLIGMLEMEDTTSDFLTQQVLSLCCNLVILDDSLDVFRFAHASVREFLEAQPRFGFQDINLRAAEECLYMVFRTAGANQLGFTEYARTFWIEHYCDLDYHFRASQPLATEVKDFFMQGLSGDGMLVSWFGHVSFNSGLEVSAVDRTSYTPLHIACFYGLLEVVETMIELANVDVISSNVEGLTALYVAVSRGHLDVVEKLLAEGADPNTRTQSQETALHRAAESGHQKIALLLLRYGIDVVAQDDRGWTALDWAIRGNHVALVSLLILNGSESEAMQKYGQSLVFWARDSPTRDPFEGANIIHRATGCIGIRNEGQTGYLNAILHFLYSIEPFHRFLWMLPTSDEHLLTVSEALRNLFDTMVSSVNIVSTRELTKTFGWDLELLQQPNDPFGLFIILMTNIKDTLLHDELQQGAAKVAFESLFWSHIEDLQGFRPKEAAFYIVVDVSGHDTFERAFQAFGVDDNKESPRYGLPRWQPSYPALVLVFELRRFRYNMQIRSIEKVHDRCSYPSYFTIHLTNGEQVNYVLHGVIVHRGDFTTGAKILIFLKSHHNNRWIRCRNEQVTWAAEEEVFEGNFGSDTVPERLITSCTATGLIYIQKDKVNEIARVMVPYGPHFSATFPLTYQYPSSPYTLTSTPTAPSRTQRQFHQNKTLIADPHTFREPFGPGALTGYASSESSSYGYYQIASVPYVHRQLQGAQVHDVKDLSTNTDYSMKSALQRWFKKVRIWRQAGWIADSLGIMGRPSKVSEMIKSYAALS